MITRRRGCSSDDETTVRAPRVPAALALGSEREREREIEKDAIRHVDARYRPLEVSLALLRLAGPGGRKLTPSL